LVWPLRYAPRVTGRRGIPEDGVWAPPGRYTIALTVDGEKLTAALEVGPDPRVSLPASAYAEQFVLAREVEEARAQVATMTARAASLQRAVFERRRQAGAPIASALDAFAARAAAVSGVPAGASAEAVYGQAPPSTDTLRFVETMLASIAEAVDGADAVPSVDARDGLSKARALFAATAARWETLVQKDLGVLNGTLTAAGSPALPLP